MCARPLTRNCWAIIGNLLCGLTLQRLVAPHHPIPLFIKIFQAHSSFQRMDYTSWYLRYNCMRRVRLLRHRSGNIILFEGVVRHIARCKTPSLEVWAVDVYDDFSIFVRLDHIFYEIRVGYRPIPQTLLPLSVPSPLCFLILIPEPRDYLVADYLLNLCILDNPH